MARPPPDPLFTLRGSMARIHCLYLLIDKGEFLYVGTEAGMVHIWDFSSYRELNSQQVSDNACLSIGFNDLHFITLEKGGHITFWKETLYKWEKFKLIEIDYIGYCRIFCSSTLLAFPYNDEMVKVKYFHNKPELSLKVCSDKYGKLMVLNYIRSLDSFLCVYESGSFIVWSNSGQQTGESSFTNECPMAVAVCDLTLEGVMGSNSEQVVKFALSTKGVEQLKAVSITNPGVSSLAVSDDGKICVAGCWDGRLRYFSMKSMKLLAVLCHHVESVECVIFSKAPLKKSKCHLLFAGCRDKRVSIWDLYMK